MTSKEKKPSPYGTTKFTTIDEYQASFPREVQEKLQELRLIIRQVAPQAIETISYNIPTFKITKNLVHYAGFKHHIGLYPTPKLTEVFKKELSGFKFSKGAVQFLLNKPLPVALIKKMVMLRLQEEKIEAQAPILSSRKKQQTCANGHRFFKTSDCPDCPLCEKAAKPANGFLSLLSAPARRALVNAHITTLAQLADNSEKDLLKLHGLGKTSIPILKNELEKAGLSFKN